MSEAMKQERDRRYAILITALQDFMGADQRYTSELESLLNVEKKAVEKIASPALSKKERLVQKARRKKEELEKREGEEKREEKT